MKWERQEPGWYTSELGGLCREGVRWWFYPSDRGEGSIYAHRYGPYRTLAEGKRVVESAKEKS